jgi:hypothetical protein
VHGGRLADFDQAASLIRDLGQAFPAHRVVFTCPELETYRTLRSRDPGQVVVAAPRPWRPIVRRFFRALDPVVLIWLDRREPVPGVLLAAARARSMPVVAAPDPPTWATVEDALASIAREPPPDSGVRRREPPFPLALLARWIAARTRRRIADWEALAARLGHPETILCLGNGPTSEDPAVVAVAHDCLMRANWRWIDRGLLTHPDLVVVGDPATVDAVVGPVLVFRSLHKERKVLLRHLVRRLGERAPTHFTIDRVPGPLNRAWPTKPPTSGATMIAVAARLRPRRLVIAGIDLFSDPRGRYPGDPLGRNAYSVDDDPEVDLAVIEAALEDFPGEVTLLSPALETALRARRTATYRGSSDRRGT